MAEYTSFEDVTPPEGEIELPRGYVTKKGGETLVFSRARVREVTGVEEDIMDNASQSFTAKMMRVVGNCLVSLHDDDGHDITDEKTLQEASRTMSLGDLTACMFEIRCVTRGTEHRQKVTCPNPQCSTIMGQPFSWTARFDLRKEFPAQKCQGDPKHIIRSFTTRRGSEITWRFLTGEDRLRFESNHQKAQRATAALMMRIVTVNGEPVTADHLRKMSIVEREEIRDHMIPQEGSIDMTFDAVCTNCGHEFKDVLAINGFDFFYPSETQDA